MTISGSSAWSVNVLLIFQMHDLNGALRLKPISFCALSFSFAAATAAKRSVAYFHNNICITIVTQI